MQSKRLFVVLGMHRSGTSAVTKALEVLGVRLGEHLMVAKAGNNDSGFFEDLEVVALNEAVLQALGTRWHGFKPINRAELGAITLDTLRQRGAALLQERLREHPWFGLKDPRMARLVGFWQPAFESLAVPTRYVIVCRHPASVAWSLHRRDGFELSKGYWLWLEHSLRALRDTLAERPVVMDYDALMDDPEAQLRRMAGQLEIALEADSPAVAAYARGFLRPELRHTRFSAAAQALPPDVEALYALLRELASDELAVTDAACAARLGGIEQRFLAHRSTLECLQVYDDRHWQAEQAQAEERCRREEVEREIERQMAHAAALEELREDTQREVEREIERQMAHAAALEELREDTQRELERESERAVILEQEHAEAEREIARQVAHATALEQQREETRRELEHQRLTLQAALESQQRQLEDLRQTLDEVYASRSWRMTAAWRAAGIQAARARQLLRLAPLALQRAGGVRPALRKGLFVLRAEGLKGVRVRLRQLATPALVSLAPASVPLVDAKTLPKPLVIPRYLDPERAPTAPVGLRIAVHLHLFYPEMAEVFAEHLRLIPCAFDLFVSVPETQAEAPMAERLRGLLPSVQAIVVERVPNRGRDIAPMIIQFGERLLGYDAMVHLHTKKSPHCRSLADWCDSLLETLLGAPGRSEGCAAAILELLQEGAAVVFAEDQQRILQDQSGWGGNHALAAELLSRFSERRIEDYPVIAFPQGCMFWARPACLRPFLTLPLSWSDFPAEPIPADGTIAHALERLLLVFADGEGRRFIRLHQGDSIADYRYYEQQQDFSARIVHDDVKVLTYYLPQFHPIPENDRWHGKGFTEWTKVRQANPLFVGHYQQHIPHPSLGYYLLESARTLQQQAELMRQAGVHGQVFYHYWFSGSLILEQPAQLLLKHPEIPMPFCFCWANENWTRRWDGNEREILIGQSYSADDARAFIRYLKPFFADARYLRVDGRPLLFVYRPASMPDPQQYLAIWAQECASWGLPAPYVVAVLTRGAESPEPFGMDAGVERPLHDWTNGAVADIRDQLLAYEPLRGSVLPYEQVAAFYQTQTEPKDFTWFRSLVPTFDNTPRYAGEAIMTHGATPELFQAWLASAISWTQAHLPAGKRLVVINAWNEWAESAHLEPDSRFGWSYLNAVGRALAAVPYGAELNPQVSLPAELHLRIQLEAPVRELLSTDPWLRRRFLRCLMQSTILTECRISLEGGELQQALMAELPPGCRLERQARPDFLLQVRKPALFAPDTLAKLLQTALSSRGSMVIGNHYDRQAGLVLDATNNGSVSMAQAFHAPLVLFPAGDALEYKNVRMRADAPVFVSYPGGRGPGQLPKVTTVIRVHQGSDFRMLERALFCLAAMEQVVVLPLITAQGLSAQQTEQVQRLLDAYPSRLGDGDQLRPYPVMHFKPSHAGQDLRSQMLNEGLKAVRTRYVGFLDDDDLLQSDAYAYLLGRLGASGQCATFGRVYSTLWDSQTGLFIERKQEFTHGRCFDDFWRVNPAPLHSFLLDLQGLSLESLEYQPEQRYLEDYYLTLQLLTPDNTDWESLSEPRFIGDYLHDQARAQSLACVDEDEREAIVLGAEYQRCMASVEALKQRLAAERH